MLIEHINSANVWTTYMDVFLYSVGLWSFMVHALLGFGYTDSVVRRINSLYVLVFLLDLMTIK